jgi:hypothetical protein
MCLGSLHIALTIVTKQLALSHDDEECPAVVQSTVAMRQAIGKSS